MPHEIFFNAYSISILQPLVILVALFSFSSSLYPFKCLSTTMSPEFYPLLLLLYRAILIFPALIPKLIFRPIIAYPKPIKMLVKIQGPSETTSFKPMVSIGVHENHLQILLKLNSDAGSSVWDWPRNTYFNSHDLILIDL